MKNKITKERDQDGRPIDNDRIGKYEAMCHFMVRKYLPALSLYEASMDYSDLINQCRYEVMMALANFSSEKAMSSFRTKKALDENGNAIVINHRLGKPVYLMIPDEEKRQLEIARKSKDPETALRKAEESIVYGRLNNYMRRVRWKFSPTQHGGRTISADMIISNSNQEFFEVRNRLFGHSVDPSPLMQFSALIEKEKLLDILEEKGAEAVKRAFDGLSEDMRSSVLEAIGRPSSESRLFLLEMENQDVN